MLSKATLAGLLAAYTIPSVQACIGHLAERGEKYTPAPERNPLLKRVPQGGRCGVNFANAACDPGLCCSGAGWCGTTPAHCLAPDCQLSFGDFCDGNRVPPGPNTANTPRPKFGSVIYGRDIYKCTVKGKIALTYDDGPWQYTAELLDVLKANNVRATFFVVGNNKNKNMINNASTPYPGIIRRMIADGHQVASHTWGHADLTAITSDQRKLQMINNERAIADILGYFPTYMRPPYSRVNADVYADMATLGYHITSFDLDTHDWEGDQTVMTNSWLNAMNKGPSTDYSWLAIAHDLHAYTVRTYTQFMIDQAKAKGYQFVPVGECLADPPQNWYRNPTTGQPVSGTPPQNPTTTTALPTASPTCMCPCACTATK